MNRTDYIKEFQKKKRRLPTAKELSTAFKVSERTALHELSSFKVEKKAPIIVKTKTDKNIFFLRYFLILLSAMAFILSVYFTGLWFTGRFPFVIAGLISFSMVLFMVIAPQVIRYTKNKVVKSFIICSFLIALVFSMGSTLAGQFNATTKIVEIETNEIYIQHQTKEAELLTLIDEAKIDKEAHSATLVNLSGTEEKRLDNWQQIATERKYIDQFNLRIDEYRKELNSIRDKMAVELNNGTVTEKRDFYSFVSGITGKEKSFIEFMISALPAIFIDLIAALCLNLALFIRVK
jgi:membrane protein YdbS with pleckstrin-like domain